MLIQKRKLLPKRRTKLCFLKCGGGRKISVFGFFNIGKTKNGRLISISEISDWLSQSYIGSIFPKYINSVE